MFDEDFDSALKQYLKDYEKNKEQYPDDPETPPIPKYYHPKWEAAEWYQVYETVSEGTPVTPSFATQEELIDYLVNNGDFWDQNRGDGGWTRKAAESFVKGQRYRMSAIFTRKMGLQMARDIEE